MSKEEDKPIVVVAPILRGDGSSGGGNGGGSRGGSGGRIPTGYKPYGDGSKYMITPNGRLEITPEWKARIEAGETDWWGVALDLAEIVGGSATGVLSGPAKYAAGALYAGLKAWSEQHGNDKPKGR